MMDCKLLKTLWVCLVLTCFMACLSGTEAFNLTLLHTNDVHARIEETNKYSGTCTAEDAQEGKCYGGISRIRTMVKQMRDQYPNTLLLDAGDQFQGTLWFFEFGGIISSLFMNLIGYDAMALGNHEFDNGVAGLVPFVNNATFSVLSANANFSRAPELSAHVKKSTVVTVGAEKIGVIGYTTVETTYISNPGTVTFNQELASIQLEADKLTSQGVNKIIALGHAGFNVDLELARRLSGVDVIVGGHTNTFLYTGDAPSNEDPVNTYPTVVDNMHDDQSVLVVQDYAYGKYLGVLHVTFDDDGKVTSFGGNPVLLDNSVEKDNETEEIVHSYLPRLESLKKDVIGQSHVRMPIENAVCRIRECNLGNLVADGVIRQNIRGGDSTYWSDVAIAVVNSGSLRAPIEKGEITVEMAVFVQPFQNTVDIVVLTGQTIKDMFEFGATRWTNRSEAAFGGFFQVSGIKVVYDMRRPEGQRVVQLLLRCSDCLVPKLEPVNLSKSYQVLMSSFVSGGGDGYSVIAENILDKHILGNLDSDIFIEHIREQSPVYPGLEGRIQFVDELEASGEYDFISTCDDTGANSGPTMNDTCIQMSVLYFMILLMSVWSFVL